MDEINRLNGIIKQIDDEMKMNGLEIKNIHTQLEEFQKMRRQINSLLKCPSESDFNLLKGRVEGCEKAESLMKKTLTDHEKRLKNLKNSSGGGGVENSVVEEW